MLEHDLEQSVGYWTIRAADAFRRAVTNEVSPHGITFRQCQVLGWLAIETPLSQAQLADQMNIEPPTLVGILDRMERDGWIQRAGCPNDRRKKLIYPTDNAQPVWARILECGRRVRAAATRGMSADEVNTLQRLLLAVEQNLSDEAPTSSIPTSTIPVAEIE